jgi:hypothetical protein
MAKIIEERFSTWGGGKRKKRGKKNKFAKCHIVFCVKCGKAQ